MVEGRAEALLALPPRCSGCLEGGDVLNLSHEIERLACGPAHQGNGDAPPDHLVWLAHQTLFDLVTGDLSAGKLQQEIAINIPIFGEGYLSEGCAEQLGLGGGQNGAQGTVDLQEVIIFRNESHPRRGMGEGAAKALLALAQRRLCGFAAGDVTGVEHYAGDARLREQVRADCFKVAPASITVAEAHL